MPFSHSTIRVSYIHTCHPCHPSMYCIPLNYKRNCYCVNTNYNVIISAVVHSCIHTYIHTYIHRCYHIFMNVCMYFVYFLFVFCFRCCCRYNIVFCILPTRPLFDCSTTIRIVYLRF